jgi:predicted alpha/beta hydrolase
MLRPHHVITKQDLLVTATDGFQLAATCYQSQETKSIPILINSGIAIRRWFYDDFARFLAQHGFTVYTYDYRGIGDSRPASLRKFEAFAHEWGEKDTAGMIEYITAQQAERVVAIGHSMGG